MARTPIHPGEHLAEELREIGISAAELARQIEVPVNRVTAIVNGQRGVTADTALSGILAQPAIAPRQSFLSTSTSKPHQPY
jgi:addiction module HigA family antidote